MDVLTRKVKQNKSLFKSLPFGYVGPIRNLNNHKSPQKSSSWARPYNSIVLGVCFGQENISPLFMDDARMFRIKIDGTYKERCWELEKKIQVESIREIDM